MKPAKTLPLLLLSDIPLLRVAAAETMPSCNDTDSHELLLNTAFLKQRQTLEREQRDSHPPTKGKMESTNRQRNAEPAGAAPVAGAPAVPDADPVDRFAAAPAAAPVVPSSDASGSVSPGEFNSAETDSVCVITAVPAPPAAAAAAAAAVDAPAADFAGDCASASAALHAPVATEAVNRVGAAAAASAVTRVPAAAAVPDCSLRLRFDRRRLAGRCAEGHRKDESVPFCRSSAWMDAPIYSEPPKTAESE
ncbi:hypothetical protein EMWEY_00007400 [Eimeria maxima]|uniref:Uncharacterized protein n=1 Tax=Eimeria maxima TaxID=5804 RepID=U6LZ80_EIMMA|nr:hypothetical protein EMWEY_00007400 [Eimeria maxima]CDJ57277.1 hypothetical protein EMWEY_00007400 [Eimeria maxima]